MQFAQSCLQQNDKCNGTFAFFENFRNWQYKRWPSNLNFYQYNIDLMLRNFIISTEKIYQQSQGKILTMHCLLVASILFTAACAAPAGPPPPYHPPPPPYHAPKPVYGQPKYEEPKKPYSYAYAVKDEYAGTDFSAAEDSDGKAVTGHYTVLLPDGRRQTVAYTADHYAGYIADVSYEGHAAPPPAYHKPAPVYGHKPVHKPVYPPPPPAYKPAPVYHPVPAYPPIHG